MAHELFDDRFVARGAPAWHRLGHVVSTDETVMATDAYSRAPFIITKEALTTKIVNPLSGVETAMEIADAALMRWPTPDDQEYRFFGTVGPDYHHVGPDRLVEIVDAAVGRSIETYGALKMGSEMFVTYEMPGFDVRGDAHKNYLVLWAPWNGVNAYRVFTAPLRVVCNNTLMMAMGVAGEMLKISHDKNSEQRLSKWMTGMYERALIRNEKIESALDLMASKRVKPGQDDEIIERALPLPNRPRLTPDVETNEKRDAAWDIAAAAVTRKRSQVKVLWEGMGWGMDTRAAAGTFFGLYNAGVEALQYAPVKKEEVGAYDLLFGKKAQMGADIFSVAFDYAMRS